MQFHLVKDNDMQRQYLTWQEQKQPQKFLLDLETENYS